MSPADWSAVIGAAIALAGALTAWLHAAAARRASTAAARAAARNATTTARRGQGGSAGE